MHLYLETKVTQCTRREPKGTSFYLSAVSHPACRVQKQLSLKICWLSVLDIPVLNAQRKNLTEELLVSELSILPP